MQGRQGQPLHFSWASTSSPLPGHPVCHPVLGGVGTQKPLLSPHSPSEYHTQLQLLKVKPPSKDETTSPRASGPETETTAGPRPDSSTLPGPLPCGVGTLSLPHSPRETDSDACEHWKGIPDLHHTSTAPGCREGSRHQVPAARVSVSGLSRAHAGGADGCVKTAPRVQAGLREEAPGTVTGCWGPGTQGTDLRGRAPGPSSRAPHPGEHAHLSSAWCEAFCGSGDRSPVSGTSEKQDHVPRPTAPALRARWTGPRLPQPHSEPQSHVREMGGATTYPMASVAP